MAQNNLLYRKETDAFLNMLNKYGQQTEESVFAEQLKSSDENRFHPISIAQKIIKSQDLLEPDNQNFLEILNKIFSIDPTTGYFSIESMPVIVGLAHRNAKNHETDVPVCMIEGDIINMGGGNEVLGYEGMDKLIHEMCRITREELQNANSNKKIEVQAIRSGGDELRLVVYGLERQEIQETLRDKVYPKINLLTAKLGLNEVPHTKETECKTHGVGIAFGAVDLKKVNSETEMRDSLNKQIEYNKMIDGLMRFGVTDDKGIDKYIKDLYTPYLQRNDKEVSPEIIAERKEFLKEHAITAKNRWENLRKSGVFGSKNNSPNEFFAYLAKDQDAARTNLNKIELAKADDIEPFDNTIVPIIIDEPDESIRLRRALKAFGYEDFGNEDQMLLNWNKNKERYELTAGLKEKYLQADNPDTPKLQLILNLMEMLDAPNPISRCRSSRFLEPDTLRYMRRMEQDMQVLKIELECLNGANAINPDLGDAVLREIGGIIRKAALPNNGRAYQLRNGEFAVLLKKDCTPQEIDTIKQTINNQIYEKISNKAIIDFARETYANPRIYSETSEAEKKLNCLKKDIEKVAKKYTEKHKGTKSWLF